MDDIFIIGWVNVDIIYLNSFFNVSDRIFVKWCNY